jgi:hypothetical protein
MTFSLPVTGHHINLIDGQTDRWSANQRELIMVGVGSWCLTHFQQYFSYIMAVSFIGGGNRGTQ